MFRYELNVIKRFKPKGFNLKAWVFFVREAENKKIEAGKLLSSPDWFKGTSQSQREYVCHEYASSVFDLAKENYIYCYMRACGQTFLGALDESARDKFEKASEKKISSKNYWKYDHLVHNTSAKLQEDGKSWKVGF